MRRIVLLIAAMSLSMGVFAQQAGRITIDGKLNEPFWQRVKAEPLRPAEPGVPAKLGGEVRAAIAGGYLYIGATLPEPTGHFTARSIGRNPLWEGGVRDRSATGARSYTYGSPDGEDFVRFILHIYNENDWLVQVGPLGGNSIKWHWSGEHAWYPSMPYKCNGFMIATSEGNNVWTAEIAIPLEQIGTPEPGYVQLKVERNRAWRPRSPEEWWVWPLHNVTSIVPTIQNAKLGAPVYQPRLLGTDEHLPPIQAGHVSSVPPLQSKWTGPGWADVPAWNLWRNEAAKRLPEFPTEVKLVQDGSTLAVLARMYEPDHVIPQEKNVHGDSFSVYLATTGSSYVEYTINSEGTIDQAAGHQGGPRLGRPHSWKSPATGAAWQENGEWFARLNVPLARISEALGEVNIPGTWRILLERTRPERGGEPSETSVLPDTESTTSDCPARYRRMELSSVSPSQLPKPSAPERPGNIGVLPGRVFSAAQRKQMNLSNMLPDYERTVGKEMIAKANQAWASVGTVAEWDEYRDQRIDAMKKSLGQMPAKAPLDVHISSDYHGNGYHRQNLVFQSQPGIWVTADLYLPDPSRNQMPGMIIFPSHHGPKTQFEVQDMGIMWAREGCAVLAIDQIGYGGRIQTYPWDRANYDSLYTIGEQLYLTNSSLITWMIQDVEASINLLWQRPDVNKKEIILLGSVAGGAEPMAYTAALDSRVAAVVPFNFGRVTPLNDPMGGEFGDWESDRSPRWSISGQFLPWLICASVAPRYLILSKEVNWDKGELKPVWTRDEKVWGFYDATDHLAEAHGFGTFPGPGEAWSIGPGQRRALEPILERWFGIPIPW
ncbi:MAG: acetylxylan esterase, partial [Terriglobia bacterium]